MATWSPFLKFHVIPVLDILEATPLQQEAAELLESIS